MHLKKETVAKPMEQSATASVRPDSAAQCIVYTVSSRVGWEWGIIAQSPCWFQPGNNEYPLSSLLWCFPVNADHQQVTDDVSSQPVAHCNIWAYSWKFIWLKPRCRRNA